METYRRGHNGPDSKSGIRQRIVGSNPTASANKNEYLLGTLFYCWWDKNPWVRPTFDGPTLID